MVAGARRDLHVVLFQEAQARDARLGVRPDRSPIGHLKHHLDASRIARVDGSTLYRANLQASKSNEAARFESSSELEVSGVSYLSLPQQVDPAHKNQSGEKQNGGDHHHRPDLDLFSVACHVSSLSSRVRMTVPIAVSSDRLSPSPLRTGPV